ncbi:MAG: T9SS type A sorting domain-containing protein [Bacteroidetes bacterium]|nr:T9SS type A sorting domain-containing protein [Bacteroidota bacterium]
MPGILFSQIVIDQSDMPEQGDTIRLSTAFDISGIDFEETGENYTWDFTDLEPVLQRVDTFVSVQETPWVYQLIFFLSANLAKKQFEFDQIPGFEVTDVYEYYKSSNTDFRSVGFGITLNGIPLPNKYDDPDIIYKFPLNYGNVDSSQAEYGIDIPGIGYSGGWKKRVNHVDGWGTLHTPFGTFEAIRIRSEIQQFDSLYIDSLGFGFPIYRELVEYKWMGEGQGLPLMKVTDDGLLPNFVYIDSLRTTLTNVIDDRIGHEEPLVFPNPTKGFLTIEIPEMHSNLLNISVYNELGMMVIKKDANLQNHNQRKLNLDLSNAELPEGMYYLVLHFEDRISLTKVILQ